MIKFKGLSGIYSTTVLQKIATGLITLFIPIYIFSISNNLIDVFIYQIIFRITLMATTIPVTNLINSLGPDTLVVISNFIQVFYFTLFVFAKSQPLFLYPAAILNGIATASFWIPYHLSFSSLGEKGGFPKQIATLYTFSKLAATITPLIGGIVAAHLGLSVLFPLGGSLLILSSIPILFDDYNLKTPKTNLMTIFRSLTKSNQSKLYLSYFFDGFRISIDNNFWPVVMYAVLPNLEKIGGLKTISLVLALFLANVLGEKIKKFNLTAFLSGNIVRNTLWAIRGLNFGPIITLLTEPLYRVAGVLYKIPQKTITYESGENGSALFFAAREWAIGLGILTADLIALVIILTDLPDLSISIIAIIGISASTLLLPNYVKNNHN